MINFSIFNLQRTSPTSEISSCPSPPVSALAVTLISILFFKFSFQSCHVCFSICLKQSPRLCFLRDLPRPPTPCHHCQPPVDSHKHVLYLVHLLQSSYSSGFRVLQGEEGCLPLTPSYPQYPAQGLAYRKPLYAKHNQAWESGPGGLCHVQVPPSN